jgi:mannose-6-phosphate isomerase-like protein (cupin superfamily)
MSKRLIDTLDSVDIGSISQFIVTAEHPTELHYHDFDEYWFFTEGNTNVTLRLPNRTEKKYKIGPGDLVVTPKNVEHGHTPHGIVTGIQWNGEIKLTARTGHLYRELEN